MEYGREQRVGEGEEGSGRPLDLLPRKNFLAAPLSITDYQNIYKVNCIQFYLMLLIANQCLKC
jgi:hypothetical protein